MSSLRLERIWLTLVALPGADARRTVVRLVASDGSEGLGEADGSPRAFRAARAICGGLIGIDPLDINRLHRARVDGAWDR